VPALPGPSPPPRCCSERAHQKDQILTGHVLLRGTFIDHVSELIQIDLDHVLNGVPVTAGQGWAHPGLVEADDPSVLIKRTQLDVLQQAQPLCVHEGGVLKGGGLEQPDGEGPWRQGSRGGEESGRGGLGKAEGRVLRVAGTCGPSMAPCTVGSPSSHPLHPPGAAASPPGRRCGARGQAEVMKQVPKVGGEQEAPRS